MVTMYSDKKFTHYRLIKDNSSLVVCKVKNWYRVCKKYGNKHHSYTLYQLYYYFDNEFNNFYYHEFLKEITTLYGKNDNLFIDLKFTTQEEAEYFIDWLQGYRLSIKLIGDK